MSRFRVCLLASVVAALGLRLLGLGQQEIWADEAASLHMATAPDWFPWRALVENTPPLYYGLLKGWLAVGDLGVWWLRLPSALAGTAFVALTALTGRALLGERAGIFAAWIAAASPVQIYYAQEARAYVFLMTALLAAYLALWRALERDRLVDWSLFAGCVALAGYTHFSSAIALLPTFALVALRPHVPDRDRSRVWTRFALALAAAASLCLPWYAASLVARAGEFRGTAWVADAWAQTPPALAIPLSLESFTLGGQVGSLPISLKQFATLEFPTALRIWGWLAFGGLALFAVSPAGDAALGVAHLSRRKALLAIWLFAPLAVLWLGSLARPIYAVGRYDMIASLPVALWLGLGLAKISARERHGRAAAAVACGLLMVPVAAKLARYYAAPPVGDARATAAYLDAHVASGDAVVFTGLRGGPVIAHLAESGYRWEEGDCRRSVPPRRFACRMYPRETERTPGIYDTRRIDADPDAVREDAAALEAALDGPGSAIWAVFEYGVVTREHGRERLELDQVDLFLLRELSRRGFGNDFGPDGGAALRIVRFER